MQEEIKKLARKLYEDTYKEFLGSNKSFKEILDKNLNSYNRSFKVHFKKALIEIMQKELTKNIKEILPKDIYLSNLLYKNATEVKSNVLRLFKKNSKKTIKEVVLKLYEGYNFREKEVLEIRKKTPLYIQKYLEKRLNQKRIEKDIEKLKTKPLKTAYKKLLEVSRKHDDEATKRALKIALEEKARYYANRIAVTEQQRALNLGRAKEFLEDEEVEFVKYKMSSKHPMIDICDYFANLDIGYGRGIVPKDKMITLPLHPHCMCRYVPYYRDVECKNIKEPEKATLEKFSKEEQRQILGSWEAYKEFKENGNIFKVFNKNRPKYPIKKVEDALKELLKNIKVSKSDIIAPIIALAPNITIPERLILEEDTIRYNSYETAVLFDKDGQLIETIEGNKSNVVFKEGVLDNAVILTHNHPSGSSFSYQDINLAIKRGIKIIRAVGITPDGKNVTYTAIFNDDLGPYMDIYDLYYKHYDKYYAEYEKRFLKAKTEDEKKWIYLEHTHKTLEDLSKEIGFEYIRQIED